MKLPYGCGSVHPECQQAAPGPDGQGAACGNHGPPPLPDDGCPEGMPPVQAMGKAAQRTTRWAGVFEVPTCNVTKGR